MANLRKALQSSYNWLVAAEMFRPASSVCRTWLRSSTSPWLCDAIEWVKTTRNGVKEEKSRTLNIEYCTSGGKDWGTYQPEYTRMLGVLFADNFAQFSTWHCKAILAA